MCSPRSYMDFSFRACTIWTPAWTFVGAPWRNLECGQVCHGVFNIQSKFAEAAPTHVFDLGPSWFELQRGVAGERWQHLVAARVVVSYCCGPESRAVVLEHPAMPVEPHKPSIWRTAIVSLLSRRPFSLFYTRSIQQWRFGAVGVKPTTFLCANVSLDASLERYALVGVQKPSHQFIGIGADGSFRTASTKEYPNFLMPLIVL